MSEKMSEKKSINLNEAKKQKFYSLVKKEFAFMIPFIEK